MSVASAGYSHRWLEQVNADPSALLWQEKYEVSRSIEAPSTPTTVKQTPPPPFVDGSLKERLADFIAFARLILRYCFAIIAYAKAITS
jgi:hypothetical protein